jgi:hypothetical protein
MVRISDKFREPVTRQIDAITQLRLLRMHFSHGIRLVVCWDRREVSAKTKQWQAFCYKCVTILRLAKRYGPVLHINGSVRCLFLRSLQHDEHLDDS